MAGVSNKIGDIVKKCKILLLDIEGTTTSISFVKEKLFPYAEENVQQFLENQWNIDEVKEVITALRKLALEDQEKSVEGVIAIPGEDASKEDQIEALVKNVKWQMSSDRKAGALKQLQGLIWKQGYDKGDIKGHVFEDVSSALEQWHSCDGQKVYIYSSGSVQAQKLLFGQSLSGDLLPFIDGHFDTAVGGKQEASSYTAIVEKIGCTSKDVLFLTDIVKEAEAARSAGLNVALVSREGNAPLSSDATDAFAVIHSLAELTISNKRKTDPPQGEEQPAKVLKTDVTNDETKDNKTETEEKKTKLESTNEEVEKMEIEEEKTVVPKEKVITEAAAAIVAENVTDKDNVSTPIADNEPKVIEKDDKVDKPEKEVEVMDIDVKEKDDSVKKVSDNTEDVNTKENVNLTESSTDKTTCMLNDALVDNKVVKDNNINVENSSPTNDNQTESTITEIVEITNDKEVLSDVVEIIEDLQPIVEEPTTNEDIEKLQIDGDVLEKECDEILSKVQDVTNLNNMPLKPALNSIEEESMETENTDTSDIVESILDTELGIEVKKPTEIEINKEIEKEEKNAENQSINDISETNKNGISAEAETIKLDKEKGEESSEQITVDTSSSVKETNSANEENETQTSKENPLIEDKKIDGETNTEQVDNKVETVTEEIVNEDEKVNGKATNGETENKNGETENDNELSSRLSAENGKEIVNGVNGDSKDVENGSGDKKLEAEVTEIKVKTVSKDEPRTDLIEQPTEA